MRRLLTGGIKAILAIAVLSTAAHWAMRVQREPAKTALGTAAPGTAAPAMAAIVDPVSTGSITPRKIERPAADGLTEVTRGLDQRRLSELFAGAAPEKPKAQKAVAKR